MGIGKALMLQLHDRLWSLDHDRIRLWSDSDPSVRAYGFYRRLRRFRMKVSTNLRVALPCILVGSAIGTLVGGAFSDTANGIRVSVIVGGAA